MSKLQILLIEPDTRLAQIYQTAFEQAGFAVQQSPNAQIAIHKIDAGQPDVIILELQIAEHNGVEFLYELRSYPEWQNIPIIILSNVPEHESGIDKKSANKLGVKNYWYKPRTSLKKIIETLQTEFVHA